VVEILPSILAADFARLGEHVAQVEAAGCRMLHVDVMDGHFVPNISFGFPILESLRKITKMTLDVHLMIADADHYAPMFIEAGADQISVHQEACPHLNRTLHMIQGHGAKAGVVLNPGTSVSTLEEVLDVLDFVLLMSVNPGFGGQHFLPSTLGKIRKLAAMRKERGLQFPIEIDGGMDLTNVADVVDAGIEWVVVGSAVFHTVNPGDAFRAMTEKARGAKVVRA
jgi:ribulose-phosphate 3-epimerase